MLHVLTALLQLSKSARSGKMSNSESTQYRKKQKYCVAWEKRFEFVRKSHKGENFYHCRICDFNGFAGTTEIKNHAKSDRHIKNANSIKNQNSVADVLVRKNRCATKEAELAIGAFIAKHNLAFNLAPDLCNLIKRINVKGQEVQQIARGRYKTTMIVKNVLGKEQKATIIGIISNNPFAILIDESTDIGNLKQMVLVVRIFDANKFQAEDVFLTLLEVHDATAENLFNMITKFFSENKIDYKKNMVGLATDGANNMSGITNSVTSRFKHEIPHLFSIKCVCHSFNLCASHVCAALPDSLEKGLRNIYNYVHYSSKRTYELSAYQELWNLKPQKLVHPSITRWLSVIECVDRVLKHLIPLNSYFTVEAKINTIGTALEICKWFEDPLTKLYLTFLSFVLPMFTTLNREMQSEKERIHV